MGATDREFQAQSRFIAACDDPNTLLDWMREYRDSERAAVGRGEEDEARQMDDLAELAEDRAIELKAARIVATRPKARVVDTQPSPPPTPVLADDSGAELRRVKAELAASREAQARAERERVAAVALAEQHEREAAAPKFVAAPVGPAPAEIVAAPVPHNRSPEREAHRALVIENERLRLQAARARAVNQPPLAARSQVVASAPPAVPVQRGPGPAAAMRPTAAPTPTMAAAPVAPIQARPTAVTQARPAPGPAPTTSGARSGPAVEMTPLARLFQQRLTETTPGLPAARPQPPSPPERRRPAAPATPSPVVPPPADPLDGVPQHTGADLVAYRMWLGVDQRALAAKFGVGQGTISKGESRPTTLLGPALRKALHEAMSEPRQDVGGTP